MYNFEYSFFSIFYKSVSKKNNWGLGFDTFKGGKIKAGVVYVVTYNMTFILYGLYVQLNKKYYSILCFSLQYIFWFWEIKKRKLYKYKKKFDMSSKKISLYPMKLNIIWLFSETN